MFAFFSAFFLGKRAFFLEKELLAFSVIFMTVIQISALRRINNPKVLQF